MHSYLMVAGLLTVLMALAHSIFGEQLILRPLARQIQTTPNRLLQSRLPTLRFTWHITSVLGLGMAWLFFRLCPTIPTQSEPNFAATHQFNHLHCLLWHCPDWLAGQTSLVAHLLNHCWVDMAQYHRLKSVILFAQMSCLLGERLCQKF